MPSAQGPSPGTDGEGPGPEHQPERQPDDLYIEVSDLPRPAQLWFARPTGTPSSDIRPAPWYRQRVLVPRPLVAASLAVMVVLVVALLVATPFGSALAIVGLRPAPTPASARIVVLTPALATPTPSPYPTPTLVAPAIGPVPTTCPPGSPLVAFDPTATVPGVGGQGVWLVADAFLGASGGGNLGHGATAELGSLPPSEYTLVGWPVQVMVLVQVDLTQPITLMGHDLRTTYSLWFSADANNPGAIDEAAPLATIDPSQVASSTSNGRWKIWFGVLYLPGAGCYRLQASWPGGGWTVNFAAGR